MQDSVATAYCLQAATSTFVSHRSNASERLIVSPLTGGNRQTVMPKPLIFRLVTNGPNVTLLTTNPRVFRSAIAISANRASTSSLVLPRELSKITTSLSFSGEVEEEKGMKARSLSEISSSRSSICAVSDSEDGMGLSCRRPGSPCAPMPSSMVAGGRDCRSVSVAFGNATLDAVNFEPPSDNGWETHRSKATPTVPTFEATYSMTSATRSKVSPLAASAQALFKAVR